MDICIDYCEFTNCENCKYEYATKEERQKAYQEIVKEFTCPLHCKLCKVKFCDKHNDCAIIYSDCSIRR